MSFCAVVEYKAAPVVCQQCKLSSTVIFWRFTQQRVIEETSILLQKPKVCSKRQKTGRFLPSGPRWNGFVNANWRMLILTLSMPYRSQPCAISCKSQNCNTVSLMK